MCGGFIDQTQYADEIFCENINKCIHQGNAVGTNQMNYWYVVRDECTFTLNVKDNQINILLCNEWHISWNDVPLWK